MKLKSAVFVNALKVAYKRLGVSMSATTLSRIKLAVEQGDFVLFAKYIDTFYIRDGARPSEELTFHFFKELDGADTVGAVEDAVLNFNKAPSDTVNIADSDRVQKDFARFLYDTPAALEAIAKHVTKAPFLDDGFFTDDDIIQFGKGAFEAPVASDAPELDVGKSVEDAFAASEAHFASIGKPLENTFSALDEPELAYSKGATDTFALTDDDFVDVGKVVEDTPSLTDAHFYDYGLQGNASVYFAEDYVDSSYSLALDILTILDLPSLGPGKVFADAAAVEESFARQVDYSRSFDDDVYFTDDVDGEASILDDQEMQFFKFTTDFAGASDLFDRTVAYVRGFAEAPSVDDSTNLLSNKHIYDIPVASETIAKSVFRLRADSALIGDAAIVTPGKVLLDLTSIADAGSLLSQGFTSDPNYFAGDYVGTSRAF